MGFVPTSFNLWCLHAAAVHTQTEALHKAKKSLEQKRIDIDRLLESRHEMLRRMRSDHVSSLHCQLSCRRCCCSPELLNAARVLFT